MTENTNRGVFTLSGITGMLIATVLLLTILAGLSVWGIIVQQEQAQNPYVLDGDKLKMISVDNYKHLHDAK